MEIDDATIDALYRRAFESAEEVSTEFVEDTLAKVKARVEQERQQH